MKKMKDHKCEKCETQFKLQNTPETHLKAVHKTIKHYKCEKCEIQFSDKVKL